MDEIKKLNPREINSQKRSIFKTYRSNSLTHYKNISSYNYDHRIRLNPLGETKTIDIRDQIPLSHIRDMYFKSEIYSPKNKSIKTAYEKAQIFSNKIIFKSNFFNFLFIQNTSKINIK